ncbi:hypothetical protein DPX39_100011800 [Trypanosoma brucei equiperdum]|uniref:Gamma-butyrobetaine hydroxylase-like N-terminal domain-containing protein n=1 Tax=Trypanosoma brucei equiperdum TaxID=630700 RepID=A0A3L6KWW3_9TRYP|nr:hypothetical protein DPX39_100011800 [Trypanosoma brucei equiperdum]
MRRSLVFPPCHLQEARLLQSQQLFGWYHQTRHFTSLVDRLSTGVARKLSSLTETHMMPLTEKHITEPRRPYPKRPSMQENLAERLAEQRRWRSRVVPQQIILSKDKLYIEFVWSAATLSAAAAREMRQQQNNEEENGDGCTQKRKGISCGSFANDGIIKSEKLMSHRTRFLAEFLRAYSPSTDVIGADALIYGRRGITITDVIPVGNYALRIVFSDGHSGGIYPYEYLFHLGQCKYTKMREYIRRLREKRKSRDPPKRVPSKYAPRGRNAAEGTPKRDKTDDCGHRVAAK